MEAGGASGRRCHCRGIQPGRRRGEREGEGEPGTPGTGPFPSPAALPTSPSGQPLPRPPPLHPPAPRGAASSVPPRFPSPVSRAIQMFGPSSGIAQPRCPARCFLSPPGAGTACVRPGWGHRAPRAGGEARRGGRGSPCPCLHGGFSHIPCNTRGTGCLLPLPSPGGCCSPRGCSASGRSHGDGCGARGVPGGTAGVRGPGRLRPPGVVPEQEDARRRLGAERGGRGRGRAGPAPGCSGFRQQLCNALSQLGAGSAAPGRPEEAAANRFQMHGREELGGCGGGHLQPEGLGCGVPAGVTGGGILWGWGSLSLRSSRGEEAQSSPLSRAVPPPRHGLGVPALSLLLPALPGPGGRSG